MMESVFVQAEVEDFPEPLIGTVEKTIAPHRPGMVKCLEMSWSAWFYQPDTEAVVNPNQEVAIVALWGTTMLVVPLEEGN